MKAFHSLTQPVPPLRIDLELFPVQTENGEMYALRDPSGYSDEIVLFQPAAWSLFLMFDGTRSIRQIQAEIAQATAEKISGDLILSLAETLDRNLFLDSDHFRNLRGQIEMEFRNSPLRRAAHAGQSYPADPAELRNFLDTCDADNSISVPDEPPVGIIAPHIDLRVGAGVYTGAFRALQKSDAETVIILGTSHYGQEGMFILTEKDFETPLGIVKTDHEFIRALRSRCRHPLTENDFPHRIEHSIEFQALFLQHFSRRGHRRIVPILCTGFHELIEDQRRPDTVPEFIDFIEAVRTTIDTLRRNVVFILSVDWSHVGLKFGDQDTATKLLPKIQVSDLEQLEAVVNVDYARFFELVAESKNASRIDAFPAFSTFYFSALPTRGILLQYEQWHEIERESGVTFASAAFY